MWRKDVTISGTFSSWLPVEVLWLGFGTDRGLAMVPSTGYQKRPLAAGPVYCVQCAGLCRAQHCKVLKEILGSQKTCLQ